MNARFFRALDFVLKWECVYDRKGNVIAENDPADPGGLTKYGIDQRSHPKVDIRSLTRDQAAQIYLDDYWLPVRADALPVQVGEVCFDIAVNNGRSRAAKWLQTALRVRADGHIGPVTIAASLEDDPSTLALALLDRRERFYRAIAKGSMAKFLKGWLNRNNALRRFISTLSA